jgi:hypothetical protein
MSQGAPIGTSVRRSSAVVTCCQKSEVRTFSTVSKAADVPHDDGIVRGVPVRDCFQILPDRGQISGGIVQECVDQTAPIASSGTPNSGRRTKGSVRRERRDGNRFEARRLDCRVPNLSGSLRYPSARLREVSADQIAVETRNRRMHTSSPLRVVLRTRLEVPIP